jgi:hypothetical protein
MIVRGVHIAVVLAASLAFGSEVLARTSFDGAWTVLIITERGDACDRAYRYPVRIANGIVRYSGDFAINLSGRAAPNGAARVSIVSGDRRADGIGRLSRNFGSGTWRGRSSTAQCAGRWQAERR